MNVNTAIRINGPRRRGAVEARYLAFGVGLVLLMLILIACAGLDLGDMIQVRTPVSIQRDTGLNRSLSLNQAQVEYRSWLEESRAKLEADVAKLERDAGDWRESIERSNEVFVRVSQLTLNVLDQAGTVIGGIPMLAPLVPGLVGLAGLFVGRAGLRKGKEKSFVAGLDRGKALANGTPADAAMAALIERVDAAATANESEATK